MKKKTLKSLKLNKRSISNLESNIVSGGTVITFGAICIGTVVSYFACTGNGTGTVIDDETDKTLQGALCADDYSQYESCYDVSCRITCGTAS